MDPVLVGDGGKLYIGRAAAKSPRFPGRPSGSSRMMTGSSAGLDKSRVRLRAFAELVEHVGGFLSGIRNIRHVRASTSQLSSRFPGQVVFPEDLRHFDSAKTLVGIDPVGSDEVLTWYPAFRPSTSEQMYVPALAVHLQWQVPDGEPLFLKPGATGLAAHVEYDAAVRHAAYEVLERDSLMLSWRVPGWPVHWIKKRLIPVWWQRVLADAGLDIEVFLLGESGLPMTCLVLAFRNGSSEELVCGSACGPSIGDIVDRAVREALMLHWSLSHQGAQAVGDEGVRGRPRNSLEHVTYAYHMGGRVIDWYKSQARGQVDIEDVPSPAPKSTRDLFRACEHQLGGYAVVADLSDTSVPHNSWRICRVIMSNALPRESDSEISHLGGQRLEAILHRYECDLGDINCEPHPFG